MTNITTTTFEMDNSIIAPCIYGNRQRFTTNEGVEVSAKLQLELQQFLEQYIAFVGLKRKAFFRIDAYFDYDSLYILDMNASFVDGWGNALNFTRAVGAQVDRILLGEIPGNLYLTDEVYRPEFDLFLQEMGEQGLERTETKKLDGSVPTYVYGPTTRKANIFPYDGMRVDNKMNLALFSRQWQGQNIQIPPFILPSECSWDDVPRDYAIKVSGKSDVSGCSWKVNIGKPKGKVGGQLWEQGKLVAQSLVGPTVNREGENMQAIIMTILDTPICGYVQTSRRNIINDDSTQGPLIINT